MTATKAAENVAATTPLAMLAVTQHMVDQHLPAPMSISKPHVGDREILLALYTTDTSAWVASVSVDAVTDETSGVTGRACRTYHTRLPNGIQVGLITLVDTGPARCVAEAGGCQTPVGAADSIEPGCLHGNDLCAAHRYQCSECVDDFRQNRTGQ